jgi:hypothetical protein
MLSSMGRFSRSLNSVWDRLRDEVLTQNGRLFTSEQVRELVVEEMAFSRQIPYGWEGLSEDERTEAMQIAFPDEREYERLAINTFNTDDGDWVLSVTFNDPLIADHLDENSSVEVIEYWSAEGTWNSLLVKAMRFSDKGQADVFATSEKISESFFRQHAYRFM